MNIYIYTLESITSSQAQKLLSTFSLSEYEKFRHFPWSLTCQRYGSPNVLWWNLHRSPELHVPPMWFTQIVMSPASSDVIFPFPTAKNKQENLKNCGPPRGNKFDLEIGQRSTSQHGTNRKGLLQ